MRTVLAQQNERMGKMNKRLAKKIEKMRRKKIHEVLEIVLEINSTQERVQGVTGRKPTALFAFSGNVPDVDVIVDKNGWRPVRRDGERWYISQRTDRLEDIEGMLKELKNKKKELRDAGKI